MCWITFIFVLSLIEHVKGYFDQSVDIYKAPAVAQWILESAGREGHLLLEELAPVHKQCKVWKNVNLTSLSRFHKTTQWPVDYIFVKLNSHNCAASNSAFPLQLFFSIYVTPFPSSVLRASWATDRRESLVRVSTRLCNDPTRVCRWIEGHRHAINATCTPNQTTRYSSYFFTLLHNNSVHWVAR